MLNGIRKFGCMNAVTVALTVSYLGAGLAPTSLSSASSQTGTPGCGVQSSKTLRASARVRVFLVPQPRDISEVRVCQKNTDKSWLIGLPGARVERPIALSGLWAAATEERGKPQDQILRDVVARDAETGVQNLCRIGSANRPGQLITVHSLVVTTEGAMGWTGREKIQMAQPVVGACIDGSDTILARGAGVSLGSLALSGETLTWSNEGRQESFQFQ
jgi:hypothetical protein